MSVKSVRDMLMWVKVFSLLAQKGGPVRVWHPEYYMDLKRSPKGWIEVSGKVTV